MLFPAGCPSLTLALPKSSDHRRGLVYSRVGLTQGTGANVLIRAESRPASLQAQQAKQPAVGAGDSGPPPPGCSHDLAHFGKTGSRRHCTAYESSQRHSDSIRSLAPGDVITLHDSRQVPSRADDQRGVDVIVAEEFPYLADGGGQRMSRGSREHSLGSGAQDLIHRSRIRTAVRTWSSCPVILIARRSPDDTRVPDRSQQQLSPCLSSSSDSAPASAMTARLAPGLRGAGGSPESARAPRRA